MIPHFGKEDIIMEKKFFESRTIGLCCIFFIIFYCSCGIWKYHKETIEKKNYINDEVPNLEVVVDEKSIEGLVYYANPSYNYYNYLDKDNIKSIIRNRLSFQKSLGNPKYGFLSVQVKKEELRYAIWYTVIPGMAGLALIGIIPVMHNTVSLILDVKVYNLAKRDVMHFQVSGSGVDPLSYLWWGHRPRDKFIAMFTKAVDECADKINEELYNNRKKLMDDLVLNE